jgi:hypothetical protein
MVVVAYGGMWCRFCGSMDGLLKGPAITSCSGQRRSSSGVRQARRRRDDGAGSEGWPDRSSVDRVGVRGGAVREPAEAYTPGRRRKWRRAQPVLHGGRLQGRPQQVLRLTPVAQGLRGTLQDAPRRLRPPGYALLPALQQVITMHKIAKILRFYLI